MPQPFGHILNFALSRSRPWLSLGPGWAVLAGALATAYPEINSTILLQLLSVWLLVDPILGTLWDLNVRQGLWRRVAQAQLPPPSAGFVIPYAQPNSAAGHLILLLRRYRLWWSESYLPEYGHSLAAFVLGISLALLIGIFLGPAIFWLTLLAIVLILLAGQRPPDLAATSGGRLQAIVQLLLPWLMGSLLWSSSLSPPGLALALCFGSTYLGGLKMLGRHRQADKLFFLGQIAVIVLLLALRLLSGAAVITVLLLAQWLIQTRFKRPADFLSKVQPYLVFSLLVAGLSAGSLSW